MSSQNDGSGGDHWWVGELPGQWSWDANDQWGQGRWYGGWDANDQWDDRSRGQQRGLTAVADSNVDNGPGLDQQAPAVTDRWPAAISRLSVPPSQIVVPLPQIQVLPGNQTAVAGAGASDAVAPQIFDLEYFRSFGTTNNYKQHSAALKWHRQAAETAGLDSVTFSNTEANPVAEMVHDKGTDFRFVGEPKIPWRWQEMVAQMDERSMKMVVQGLDDAGRSRGLVSCRLQKTDKYDHKRHHAAGPGAGGEMLFEWHFVLVCEDGTQVFLHPNYSNTKIECYRGEPEQDHELPRGGLGGTSGPGTFKYFKNKNVQAILRFNAKLGQGKGKAKGKATGASPSTA